MIYVDFFGGKLYTYDLLVANPTTLSSISSYQLAKLLLTPTGTEQKWAP